MTQANTVNRRQILGGLGALSAFGALSLLGCGSEDKSSTTSSSTDTSSSSSSSSTNSSSSSSSSTTINGNCAIIPTETIGPYPLLA
ncbi:MAG: hypothetical protein H6997_12010, partial [Moraxellaceae bacterium]|nr:hypothetical protein [Moraxellaceae bacterium]